VLVESTKYRTPHSGYAVMTLAQDSGK